MHIPAIKISVRFSLLLLFCLMTVYLVPSPDKMLSPDDQVLSEKNLYGDISQLIFRINENVNVKIFDLPKVYTLPKDLSPAPRPDPSKFTEDSYQDDTITVKCWKEQIEIDGRIVTGNFADVVIAHPTQLRTAFAGGSYGTSKRTHASKIASANNAVIATNADFYNYRSEGIIIRQGTVFRKKAFDIDVLFIDSDGNFSVMRDKKAIASNYLNEHDIYQTLSFGPVLVENGKPIKNGMVYKSVSCAPMDIAPRTAIGQIGKLHYLMCTIDGRQNDSRGVSTNQLAVIMANKNCIIAYNLDGGQSSTMIFNNKPYNNISNGGERTMSDIVYFASSIPESEWNA